MPGPEVDNWQFTDSTDVAEIVFAPCGMVRTLNVNTEVRVTTNSSDQSAFVSMDSTDGSQHPLPVRLEAMLTRIDHRAPPTFYPE